jgi:two-component system chemotaxis response regulator CheY
MKRVMIVDDSLIIRMNLKKFFASHGYEVVAEAANGEDAVQKYFQHNPDMVTMDITMPVLDGISALKQIRARDENAVVIMISALGQEAKILEALDNGAQHYIVKPFNETDLLDRLRVADGCTA